jgi:hypothetical protein
LLIQEAGFDIERVSYCNTIFYLPVLLTRKAKNAWRAVSRRRGGTDRPLQSDLGDYPGPINDALYALMRAETRLMDRIDMPFGVSILAVARRPLEPERVRAQPAEIDAFARTQAAAADLEAEPVGAGVGDAIGAVAHYDASHL